MTRFQPLDAGALRRLAQRTAHGGLLALGLALPLAAVAAESPQSSDVDVTVRRDGEAIVIDVDLRVDASPRQAWEVLTDYDHMAGFVSSLAMSRIVARSDGKLEVAQVSQYALGPFHFKFDNLREVELVPPLEIRSRMIRGDMKTSTFTTRLLPDGGGTRIRNHGRMIPDRWIPPLIGTDMIRTATRKQFSELRAEIVRRVRHTASRPDFLSIGGSMSNYIDAIVIPVPRANLDTYKRMSTEWGNAHLRHGALYYSDSISDDAQPGKLTSFPQAVQLEEGEVIALAWVVYRSREDRERISKAVMDDPQLKESMDPSKMPFDGKRMFWGGFETIIGLSGGR